MSGSARAIDREYLTIVTKFLVGMEGFAWSATAWTRSHGGQSLHGTDGSGLRYFEMVYLSARRWPSVGILYGLLTVLKEPGEQLRPVPRSDITCISLSCI